MNHGPHVAENLLWMDIPILKTLINKPHTFHVLISLGKDVYLDHCFNRLLKDVNKIVVGMVKAM